MLQTHENFAYYFFKRYSYMLTLDYLPFSTFITDIFLDYYTPRNEVVGSYTGFTMPVVRPSVRLSVRPSVDKSYVVR